MLGKSPPASHKLPASRIIHPDVRHLPPPHSPRFGRASSLVLVSHSPKHTIELKCCSVKAPRPDNPMRPVWSKTPAMHVRQSESRRPIPSLRLVFPLRLFLGARGATLGMWQMSAHPHWAPRDSSTALGSHEPPAPFPSLVLRA